MKGVPGSLTHGHSGYAHGCHCQVCIEGHRAYGRESYSRRSGSPGHPTVDAAPFVEVFGALYRMGESIRRMAEVTGLERSTVLALCMGERRRLRPHTAERAALAVQMLPDVSLIGGETP